MAKTPDAKLIITNIKERDRLNEKANYTFRLNKALVSDFRKICDKQGVGMTQVLEELIKNFVST